MFVFYKTQSVIRIVSECFTNYLLPTTLVKFADLKLVTSVEMSNF